MFQAILRTPGVIILVSYFLSFSKYGIRYVENPTPFKHSKGYTVVPRDLHSCFLALLDRAEVQIAGFPL